MFVVFLWYDATCISFDWSGEWKVNWSWASSSSSSRNSLQIRKKWNSPCFHLLLYASPRWTYMSAWFSYTSQVSPVGPFLIIIIIICWYTLISHHDIHFQILLTYEPVLCHQHHLLSYTSLPGWSLNALDIYVGLLYTLCIRCSQLSYRVVFRCDSIS